jgi:hypothetical protein
MVDFRFGSQAESACAPVMSALVPRTDMNVSYVACETPFSKFGIQDPCRERAIF